MAPLHLVPPAILLMARKVIWQQMARLWEGGVKNKEQLVILVTLLPPTLPPDTVWLYLMFLTHTHTHTHTKVFQKEPFSKNKLAHPHTYP